MSDEHIIDDGILGDSTDEAVNGEVVAPGIEGQDLAVADDVLPEALHIMPISSRPYFPGQVQPVAVNLNQWASTLEAVGKAGHRLLGLAYVHDVDPDQATTRRVCGAGAPRNPC